VVHGLLLLISPVRHSTLGGAETAAGLYWYCYKQFQFQFPEWLSRVARLMASGPVFRLVVNNFNFNGSPKFHVVVCGQQCCVPPQPRIQSRSWSFRWRSTHLAYVDIARRVQIPYLRLHCLRQGTIHATSHCRKRDEKAFPGALVGYPLDALGYWVNNHVTRRITTSVHVVF
jgi:hypothetical protein